MNVADAPQRAQALDPTRSFCVSAPAGSGKTELLIQRFLGLLGRVERPEQVLAITFTRKAAAEMRERVIQALDEAVQGSPCQGKHEEVTRGLAQAALAWGERQGWQLLRDVSSLNIKTIDSFCAGLTRQMPVLSGFGGQAQTLDKADELYSEAVSELFDLLGSSQAVSDDLGKLLLHFDNNWEKLRSLLISMLGRRDQWHDYMGLHHTPDEAEARLLATVESVVEETLAELLPTVAPWEDQIYDLLCYAGQNLGESIPGDFPRPVAAEVSTWRQLRKLLLKPDGDWRKAVDKRHGFPAGKGEPTERKEHLKRVIEELSAVDGLREDLQALAWLPDTDENAASWQTVLQLSHVLPVLAACLLLVFRRRGVVDHSQVALSALDALGEDDAPTELALRLDYRIEHILVDEFQDTAINQYKLVRRLTRGWGEHNEVNPGNPRTLFIVGDGMQSIYGFRDANVGLFLKARSEGFNGVLPVPLALRCNFRSEAGVVDWVNDSFRLAFPEQENIRRGQVSFTDAIAVKQAAPGAAVEMHGFRGEGAVQQEAALLVSKVRGALADKSVNSIAILGRSRNQLAPVMESLQANGISYAAQEMDKLTGSPAIIDLMSLCRALANPADRVAWFALMRAPWCGLETADLLALAQLVHTPGHASIRVLLASPQSWESVSDEGRQRLAHLAAAMNWAEARRDRLALRVWVESLWLRLGGPATLQDPMRLRDAQRFFELLQRAEFEDIGLDPDWLESQLQGLFASGDNPEARLQVMTLHKAKGLEFDWVFIPALGRATRGESRDLLLWDEYNSPDGEPGFLLAADDHSPDNEPGLYNFLRRLRREKSRLETTRLLYVGATRAVKQLVLSAALNAELDEEGNALPVYRDPAAGTLLAPIWSTFREQMLEHEPEDSERDTVADSSGQLLRFRSPPTPVLDWAPPEAQGANVPEPVLNRVDRFVGTVIHLALETLSLQAELPTIPGTGEKEQWHCELASMGLAGEELDQALERVVLSVSRTLADGEAGRWLLQSSHRDAHSELALTRVSGADEVSDIVIDRTFIDEESGIRWIVDYKSSSPRDGESLDDFTAREARVYRGQLSAYRDALLARGKEPVRCALYFTSLGVLYPVSELDTSARLN